MTFRGGISLVACRQGVFKASHFWRYHGMHEQIHIKEEIWHSFDNNGMIQSEFQITKQPLSETYFAYP